MTTGGRFDFDDGGTYCGGWEDGKAHGFGVCTGPKGQGEYAGAWHCGYEISGVYTWTSGNNYRGQWTQGKRHGVGVETKGRWVYHGEWTQGFKGRYGVRQSTTTGATYEGTWTTGLQDGYGVETYADGGTYQGQWLRGIRHGYGVRQSVPYGLASHVRQKSSAIRESLTSLRSELEDDQVVKDRDRKVDESRGGFVLTGAAMPPTLTGRNLFPAVVGDSDAAGRRAASVEKTKKSSLRKTIVDGLRLRRQRSTGDIQETTQNKVGGVRFSGGSVRSTTSTTSSVESSHSAVGSVHTDSNASFISQDDVADLNMVEIYSGEWKNDKRSGFGVVERSDGLKYQGEWESNKKHGYGATTFRDGTREEGKYKNNVLVSSGRRSKLFLLRANKLKDRVENAVAAANRAAQISQQKADIAISRMASARAKAEQAQQAAIKAQSDAEKGRQKAYSYDPNFVQPGVDIMKKEQEASQHKSDSAHMGNHVGSSVVENHVPHHAQALSGSKSKVGSDSVVAPAITEVGVDSAVVGGGPAAMAVRNVQTTSKTDHTALSDESDVEKRAPPGPTKLPPSMMSPATTTSKKKDGGGGRRGAGSADTPRFSQLLNPAVIDDHFDQYITGRQPPSSRPPAAGGGSDFPAFSYDNRPTMSNEAASATDSRSRAIQRRKTLPGRPPGPLLVGGGSNPGHRAPAPTLTGNRENEAISFVAAAAAATATAASAVPVYRKPAAAAAPPPSRPAAVGGSGPRLRKAAGGNRGSMPDVSEYASVAATAASPSMPREEVHVLSQLRREELRRLREDAARRHQQDVVLRLGDIKEWCQERQLLVLVIALNISLATVFFNLLTH